MVFVKGQVSTMKGKHHSPEAKLKMSLAKKGKPSPKKGISTGIIPWNKGKHLPEEIRKKVSLTKRSQGNGRYLPCTYCNKLKWYYHARVNNKTGNHFCSPKHQQLYQIEKNNPSWKENNDISYVQIHRRVASKRGKASIYPCAMKNYSCKGMIEWASISHNANPDTEDFIPLCRSHHRRYDLRNRK